MRRPDERATVIAPPPMAASTPASRSPCARRPNADDAGGLAQGMPEPGRAAEIGLLEDRALPKSGKILATNDPARWVTKADRAYGAIREAIAAGRLEPNDAINPKLIAAELAMSIIPVREALRRLEHDGLVVIRPHIGAAVRELLLAEHYENLLIRSALEALAAELAARAMTAEVLEAMAELLARMEQDVAEGRYDRFGALNREFHITGYGVIAEKMLIRLIEQQWDQVPPGGSVYALVPHHAERAHAEHVAIYEAFRRGDAEAASRLTREHKLHARDVHRAALEDRAQRRLDLAL